jgi:hypothetical protein
MKIVIPRRIMAGIVVIAALSLACACPGTPQISDLLGGDQAVEELQQTALVLLTEVPVEGLEETAVAAMTDIPAEDMMKTAEAFATTMPVEGAVETAEAEFGDVIPGFGEGDTPPEGNNPPGGMQGEPPPDIPVLDDNENMFASKDMVAYNSSLPYADVVEFYETEMVGNGWTLPEDQGFEDDTTTLIFFEKPERSAMVTITNENDVRTVTIMITPK